MEGLTYCDYLVFVVLILSALFGAMRGFLASFLSFVGWLAAIYLTYSTYQYVAVFFTERINNPLIAAMIGHGSLLIGYLVIFGALNIIASRLTKALGLGATDAVLGVTFGVARGGVIVASLFLLLNIAIAIFNGASNWDDVLHNTDNLPNIVKNSKTLPYLQHGQATLVQFIPSNLIEGMNVVMDSVHGIPQPERMRRILSDKLYNALSEKNRQEVNLRLAELSLEQSDAQLQDSKLRMLWEKYQEQGGDNSINELERQKIASLLN